jgi:glycosyltransferase involved in cell wall biosynthesis
MRASICLYGPETSGKSIKNAYGGGSGGYTRNMATLLSYFNSDDVELLPCYHTFRGQLTFDNFFWRMIVDTVRFFCHLINHRPKVVHALAQYRSALPREFMVVCLSRLFGIPVLYEVKAGAFISAYNEGSQLYRWMTAFIVAQSKKVLCEGKVYIPFFLSEFNVEAEYFPNIVPDELVDKQDKIILAGDSLQVLFVGYCYEGKGVKPLVEACNLAAKCGVNICLTIVGEEHSEFSSWMDTYSVDSHLTIRRRGRQAYEEVLLEFMRQDIYCYPTSHDGEGHNNTINEALMTGLYVITTKQGFLADVITDERGSSLSSVEPSIIAKELIWISENKEHASKKALIGKQYLVENFMTGTNFRRLNEIYNTLIHKTV